MELGRVRGFLLTNTRSIILYGTAYKGQIRRLVENLENIRDRLLILMHFLGHLLNTFEFSGLDLHKGVNVVVSDPNIMGQLWDETNFKTVIFLGQTSLKNEVSLIR